MSDDNSQLTDRMMKEWEECRKTIERFDKTVIDLRKYGFTLITTLITAGTYFFAKSETIAPLEKAAASFVITVLIFALYTIDRCNENFIRGAVKRAEQIEDKLEMGLSKSISIYSKRAETDTRGILLYILFVISSAIPVMAGTDPDNPHSIRLAIVYGTIVFMFIAALWDRFEISRLSETRKNRKFFNVYEYLRWIKWLGAGSVILLVADSRQWCMVIYKGVIIYAIVTIGLFIALRIWTKPRDKAYNPEDPMGRTCVSAL
ncbi:MAG: hypothetical protein AB1746_01715 [Candidatus Zixiibacteriota bacterium]